MGSVLVFCLVLYKQFFEWSEYMPGVLLTNAQLRKTLASVRSLGKKGIKTYIVEETRFSPAAFSKYCTKALVCPNAEKQNGVNNDKSIVKKLNQQLLTIRVKPYYIFHPKQVKGTKHFWVSIEEGMNIMIVWDY